MPKVVERKKSKKKPKTRGEAECVICQGDIVDATRLKNGRKYVCRHSFCSKCIGKWANRETTCPCCRKSFGALYNVAKKKHKRVETRSQEAELDDLDERRHHAIMTMLGQFFAHEDFRRFVLIRILEDDGRMMNAFQAIVFYMEFMRRSSLYPRNVTAEERREAYKWMRAIKLVYTVKVQQLRERASSFV